jgi:hypothetical protein
MTVATARMITYNAAEFDPIEVHFSGMAEPFKHPNAIEIIEAVEAIEFVTRIHIYSTGEGLGIDDVRRLGQLEKLAGEIHFHGNTKGVDPETGRNPIMPGAAGTVWFDGMLDAIAKHLPASTFNLLRKYTTKRERRVIDRKLHSRGLVATYSREVSRAANNQRSQLVQIGEPVRHPVTCQKMEERRSPVVFPDGTAVACCNDYGLDLVLGNLLTGFWSDLDFESVIAKQRDPANPTICHTDCHFAKRVKS